MAGTRLRSSPKAGHSLSVAGKFPAGLRTKLGARVPKPSAVASIVIILLAVLGTSFIAVGQHSSFFFGLQNAYHPNVRLYCGTGLFVADHHCLPACPVGYHPVSFDAGLSPICMSSTGWPVSLYDLAGDQVSADGGSTVYLVVQTIPLTKVLITQADNFNTNVWLAVSPSVLHSLVTGPRYSSWTLPRVTTEVATVGDTVSTFTIFQINQSGVYGREGYPYPVCCRYSNMTIRIGDDIGIGCEGISEKLVSIDFTNQIVVFSRTQGSTPYGGCPICLSGDTLIDTPNGQVNVKSLTVGMLVWTVDRFGNRESVPILEVRSMEVLSTHEMVHVILQDGRQLLVSPGHPTADGRIFGEVRVGDLVDHSIVVLAELVPYNQSYTYDLLPQGDTGYYWANQILVGSTLK